MNLTGLSLGGILATQYAAEYPEMVNSMTDINIEQNVENIKCGCLILCGMQDTVNMKSAKLLNKKIQQSEFKIIDNSSHEVNVDNPKELSDIIFQFLNT